MHNSLYPNSLKKHMKKVNITYVGEIETISEQLKNPVELYSQLTHYENAIIAFQEIKDSKIKPDVIICDENINGMYSLDLFKLVSKLEGFNPVFILVTICKVNDHLLQRALSLKIDDVIEFPFKQQQLEKRIKFLVAQKKDEKKMVFKKKSRLKIKTNFAKRAFDIFFSFLALLMLSPILIIVGLLIKIDSKGPFLFISKRVGTGYKIFDFYKFRSMKTGAENLIDSMKDQNQYKTEIDRNAKSAETCNECESLGHECSPMLFVDGNHICEKLFFQKKRNDGSSFMKFKNDPRVTKLGHFLRKSSIDELPQLFNILKGDMSFVGNRPLPIYEAEQLTTDDWSQRFNAPAGLTGLWQVTKRGKSDMSEDERKQLDNTYAKNHSFWGDISLILKTFPALAQKENV